MLTVVTWKWVTPGYRARFTGEHVNRLAAMVGRHYAKPHRFICVTDDAQGIDRSIDIVADWRDFEDVRSPHGGTNPSCYRRLRGFHPDIAAVVGPRFVSLDLDMVAVADLVPLWDRPESFVALRDPFYPQQYNGSMWLLQAGALPEVWADFDPQRSPAMARRAGFFGSDQAWLSYRVPGTPTWGTADGVYSYRADIQKAGVKLPANARIVSFHGRVKYWDSPARDLPWVRENAG